jgi:hypothetical protein
MNWLRTQMDSLLWVFFSGGAGLWLLIQPATMMRWVQESRPAVLLDKTVGVLIIRVVAGLMLLVALLIFASTLRAGH